jgi:aminopeptidase N
MLYLQFGAHNQVRFHDPDGKAYRFLADRIMAIDERNPQLSARLVSIFNGWKLYEPTLKGLMKAELERIIAKPNLSKNVFEIVSKALV